MINGLGIVGWGVGGIEAEAGMLGQPVYFLTPDVVGVHLTGALREGVTATDLALTVTQMLRKAKVVGKFVEFFGPGAAALPVVDRATIANMAPEYGATMGFFPIDEECVNYLRATGRSEEHCRIYENYYRAQGLFGHPEEGRDRLLAVELELDLGDGRAERGRAEAAAGPHRTAEPEAGVSSPPSASRSPKTASARSRRSWARLSGCRDGVRPAAAARNRFPPEAQARNTNPLTELEMANNRPTPDHVSRGSAGRRRDSPRQRAHRRHHQLHEHEQSVA